MTTLDDLLVLLPDNDTGAIRAADLRTIVTALWNRVTAILARPYSITNSSGPANGKLYVVGAWGGPSALEIHDNASDSAATPWDVIDTGALLRLDRNDGQGSLRLTATGPPQDFGTYQSVPVAVRQTSGTAPANGALVTLYVFVEF